MSPRWTEISSSEFAHEREAVEYLRDHLPDQEPFWGWSNFEFIDDQGRINEIDSLVLSTHTLYLVEIKGRPGTLTGDAGTWTWTDPRGRIITDDNPYLLANRKAKRLKSLLQRQEAFRKTRLPYIEAVIFLSAEDLACRLDEDGRHNVFLRGADGGRASITEFLAGDLGPVQVRGHRRLDREALRALARGLEQAGIRPSQRERRVGDYKLESLLQESEAFQDWLGSHVSLPQQRNRIRIYSLAPGATADARAEVRRAAEREFLLTQRIHHPGVVRAFAFQDLDRGPAVVFDHEPGTMRLDHFLKERYADLDFSTRLRMVRQLAEALQYAHAQRVAHRALSPQTVQVVPQSETGPVLRIVDWQLGHREGSSTSTLGGAMDAGVLGDLQSLTYQAPEVLAGVVADGIKADVFSLGAVAYHLLAGRPPAGAIAELHAKVAAGPGLMIAEALDGAGHALQAVIQDATRPIPVDRLDDVDAFIAGLDAADVERQAPASDEVDTHPADAHAGDTLPGGFEVLRRLGKGASSIAYEVERENKRGILKVALEQGQNDRLRHEGEVLGKLRHQHIVPLYDVVELPGPAGPHVGLLIGASGDGKTLAQRLREEGQLTLDLLERFGGELLETVDWLEQNGVSHRDIKPDNIAIGETRNRKLMLVLFDFSLSGTPVDDMRAGTPPYRDPFMPRRRRWDLHAERFAAAVTIYEMATGLTPTWGDGQTDPNLVGDALNLDVARFDPAVRDGLTAFFRKALDAEAPRRFDNAEAMVKEWRRIFEALDRPSHGHSEPSDTGESDVEVLRKAIATAKPSAPLAALGLNVRHVNAAERLGAHTLGEFLALPLSRFNHARGIGGRTAKELRQLRDAALEGREVQAKEEAFAVSGTDPSRWSMDKLFKQVTALKLTTVELDLVRAAIGADERVQEPLPTAREAAEAVGAGRSALMDALAVASTRWEKQPWMTALREDLAALIIRLGKLAGAQELVQSLLAARGSATAGASREREAYAVLAAALETEAERESPRFQLYRGRVTAWVVASGTGADERAAYAERLGEAADALAALDPLAPPNRAQETLRQVPMPPDEMPWAPERLLQVAVAASCQAALSSRLEIYPRGMAADRALRLAAGSLLGPRQLDSAQIQQRVASRYPEAAPVPEGEALAPLLAEAGLEFYWDAGAGLFRAPTIAPGGTTGSTTGSIVGMVLATGADGADSRDFETRLRRVLAEGRFLILAAPYRRLDIVASALVDRLGLEIVSVEARLLQAMKQVAAEMEVDWEVVLDADGAPEGSEDARNLVLLVEQAAEMLLAELLASTRPMVLQHLGLLGRYGRTDLLEKLRDACRDPGVRTAGVVVLVGADDASALPRIDRTPIPIIDPADWTALNESWLVHKSPSLV